MTSGDVPPASADAPPPGEGHEGNLPIPVPVSVPPAETSDAADLRPRTVVDEERLQILRDLEEWRRRAMLAEDKLQAAESDRRDWSTREGAGAAPTMQRVAVLQNALNAARRDVTFLDAELRRNRHGTSRQVQDELEKLRGENHKLRTERDELNDRVNSLIRDLAVRRLDRTTTYSSTDRTPEEIRSTFKRYLDQDLNQVSQMVWMHRCRMQPELKEQRRLEMVRIHALLSGVSFVQESTRELLLRAETHLREALVSLREMRGGHSAKVRLIGAVESILTTLGNGAGEQSEERDRRRRTALQELGRALQMGLDADPALTERLDRFIETGWSIAQSIGRTNPPGELFAVQDGTPFDADTHRAAPGSDDEGTIRWTVQPGYRQGTRVYEPPVVFVG